MRTLCLFLCKNQVIPAEVQRPASRRVQKSEISPNSVSLRVKIRVCDMEALREFGKEPLGCLRLFR